jgi:hypothetical protein
MRAFLRWAALNVARFLAVWCVIAGAFAVAIDFDLQDFVPHSPLKALFVPVGLLLMVFAAVFTAIVALLLFLPALGPWLLLYLPALWWSERLVRGRARRLLAVALALLPFALLRTGDALVTGAGLALWLAYGLVVRLPPRRRLAA